MTTINRTGQVLAKLHMRTRLAMEKIGRKRSWRDSEKAMTLAMYQEECEALADAYKAITGRDLVKDAAHVL